VGRNNEEFRADLLYKPERRSGRKGNVPPLGERYPAILPKITPADDPARFVFMESAGVGCRFFAKRIRFQQ